MKIVLSNKVYVKVPEDLAETLKKLFTFEIPDPFNSSKPNYIPRYVGQAMSLNKETLTISRGHFESVKSAILSNIPNTEFNIIDRTISVPVKIPSPSFTLRQDQSNVVNQFEEGITRNINECLLNGNPGFGKTIAALAIAYRLQQKTLVVCTTTTIRDQWVAEVKKWFGFTPGIIGAGSIKNIESPIVIGNIQTVVKYKTELSKQFGLLVIDECHHCSATTFNDVIEYSHAKYRLGLSGTLIRKDGLHILFPGLFGTNVLIPPENNILSPTVVKLNTNLEFPGNHMMPWATRLNKLYDNPDYKFIVKALIRMALERGYVPLITSDRVSMLKELLEEFPDMRLFIGEPPHNDTATRELYIKEVLNGKATGILASTGIFSEGMSVNNLSLLIHLSSTNNESLLSQLAGRIMRIHPNKNSPIIIDLLLSGVTGINHWKSRKAFYESRGWKIKHAASYSDLDRFL